MRNNEVIFYQKLCFSGKIKKDAKFFMTNKRQKSKSGSVSEDPNLEMQTGEPTERGYAFSQEEHGAVSQKDLVRAYSRTDTRRYESGNPQGQKSASDTSTKLTSISSNQSSQNLGM